jgi:DNA-directed RNA polymerase specialized sigma24 family protein
MRASREAAGAAAVDDLAGLPVARLAERCRAEAQRHALHPDTDGRCGHQLFRRALVEREPTAWEAVAAVYGPLLAGWARAERCFDPAGEEAEALANQALARLWRQVDPARFESFPTLSSLLAYLRRCVHHLAIDQARADGRERRRARALGAALAARGGATPEGAALERVAAGEVWALVRAHCRGEGEARLAWGALVLGLPPRALLAADPAAFGSVAAINAGLANLRRRLRRNRALRGRYRALAGD